MRKTIKLIALLLLLALVPAMALAADFAVVRGGRLNLRQYASKTSRSLGKYDSGSWVTVQGQSTSGWYPVRTMDGKTGYMAGNYLTFAQNGSIGTVAYANGGYVNLRQGPSLDYAVVTRVTSGMTVNILDASYEWNYVSVNVGGATYTGYMHDSLINKSTTTATVSTRNGGKVNVRRGPSSSYGSIGSLKSGTRVTVLLKGNGWCQITGGGLTGFMATSYLSNMGTTNSGTNSNSGTVSTRTAYVNNPKSTQVLYLRESPSQSAKAIGQYANGTQVKVVSYGATWCEVYVGTRHGYMMTRYLSFNGTYVTPTPRYVYVTPTPTPQVIYITPTPTPLVEYITPTPTPLVEYITPKPAGPGTPTSGSIITLAVAYGSSSNTINVYYDQAMTSLKATYTGGKQATMLSYGDNVCMILVDGGVAYVSTWNVNY